MTAWWLVRMLGLVPPQALQLDGLTEGQQVQITASRAALEQLAEEWLPREAARRKGLPRVNGRTEGADLAAAAAWFVQDDITPQEAARMLGRTESRIRQRLRDDELGARKVGGRWRASRAAVLSELEQRTSA